MRIADIIEILDNYSVTPRKRRGQNFLVDERVASREIEYAQIDSDETVLEIGPGLGMLTWRLVDRAKKVIAIENDSGLAQYNRDRFGDRVQLIEADALEVRFPRFDKLVSNIPYSISSPLLFKLLDHKFRLGIIMIQKEFAERMAASPGEEGYSRLSVSTYYRAKCDLLEFVPRSRFWPAPEVDSMIVRLVPRKPPFAVRDEKAFFSLIDKLFQHRRKKIGTILKMQGLAADRVSGLPFVGARVETLAPEEIGWLSDAILEITS